MSRIRAKRTIAAVLVAAAAFTAVPASAGAAESRAILRAILR